MEESRQYDHEYKVQVVRFAKETGQAKAAKELGVPKTTMYGWVGPTDLVVLILGQAHKPHKAPRRLMKN